MGRPAKFPHDEIVGAAMKVAAERGLGKVTMQSVATVLGAPSGSLYHRYPSRDHLLADLWLRSVEAFQAALFDRLSEHADPIDVACAAASHVVAWCAQNPIPAKILLLFSVADLKDGKWPPAIQKRAKQLNLELLARMIQLERDLGATTAEEKRRMRMCVFDLPYGVVRSRIQGDQPLLPLDEKLVADAVRTLLSGGDSSAARAAR